MGDLNRIDQTKFADLAKVDPRGSLAPLKASCSKAAITRAMRRWSAAYGRTLSRDQVEVYLHAMRDFCDEEVEAGMAAAVDAERFPATPAAVREHCQSVRAARHVRESERALRAEREADARWDAEREAFASRFRHWTETPTTSASEAAERLRAALLWRPAITLFCVNVTATADAVVLGPAEPMLERAYRSRREEILVAAGEILAAIAPSVGIVEKEGLANE